MLIGQVKIDDELGHGVTVTKIRRKGEYTEGMLSTGQPFRLHKTKHVAELFIGHLPARSLRDSVPPVVKDVRASSPNWRGQFAGRKGERVIAKYAGYDARALREPRPKPATA